MKKSKKTDAHFPVVVEFIAARKRHKAKKRQAFPPEQQTSLTEAHKPVSPIGRPPPSPDDVVYRC